jgi:hypothetical protein
MADTNELREILRSARMQRDAALARRIAAENAGDEESALAAREKIEDCDAVIQDLEAILASIPQ